MTLREIALKCAEIVRRQKIGLARTDRVEVQISEALEDAARYVEAVADTLKDEPEIPEGWVLVPREPTAAMLEALGDSGMTVEELYFWRRRYDFMLDAAAPTVEEKGNG